jgi:ribonuclease P protein component
MLDPKVLRGKREFSAVYNKGKSAAGKYVVVFYKKNGLEYNRLGFLASKKVGNAVARNRARRLMKESVRTEIDIKAQGYDIIFIARNTIGGKKLRDVAGSIRSTLKRTELKGSNNK